jgi:hypothetical protein
MESLGNLRDWYLSIVCSSENPQDCSGMVSMQCTNIRWMQDPTSTCSPLHFRGLLWKYIESSHYYARSPLPRICPVVRGSGDLDGERGVQIECGAGC